MVTRHRRLVLIGLALAFALALLAGSAVQPATVRSDGGGIQPMTNCRCYWNSMIQLYCYKCCDLYGCWDLYCTANPGC